jgi:hypothetical protein
MMIGHATMMDAQKKNTIIQIEQTQSDDFIKHMSVFIFVLIHFIICA